MDEEYKQLFEFVWNLADIQIKKYVHLAKMGKSPEAYLNARLVFNEVNELLQFANDLLANIEQYEINKTIKLNNFINIFNQVKFYIEQEQLRSYAGWLLDDSLIHHPLLSRLDEQCKVLKEIGVSAHIDHSSLIKPLTEIQKQCEYDSKTIAFCFLDLAQKLKENPKIECDENIPHHVCDLLRRNAMIRYSRDEFAIPIDKLHKKYRKFLKNSDIKTNNTQMEEYQSIVQCHKEHSTKLMELLMSYNKFEPDSNLLSNQGKKHKFLNKSNSLFSCKNITLFGIVSSLLIYIFIAYFSQIQDKNTLNSKLKIN